MADEINFRITGDYDDREAKKAIADAEEIEQLDPEVEVGITADDQASDKLDDVTDAAEDVGKLEPEIAVTADTSQAESGIEDVGDKAQELTREDAELIVRAQVEAAKADLAALETKLHDLSGTADDTSRHLDDATNKGGTGVRANAISDLTGPLGDASSAASDFGGVFDGLADISEGVASKVGVSAESMASAIGGIGVAVAAAAALWTLYKQRQEEAKRKQKEVDDAAKELVKILTDAADKGEDVNQALADLARNKAREWIEGLGKDTDDTLASFDALGLGWDEVIEGFRTGGGPVTDVINRYHDLQDEITGGRTATEGYLDSLERVATAHGMTVEQLQAFMAASKDVEDALGDQVETQRKANDQSKQAIDFMGGAARATDQLGTASEQAARKVDEITHAFDRMQNTLDVEQMAIDLERTFVAAVDKAGQSALDAEQDVLDFKQFVKDTGEDLKKNPIEVQTVLNKVEQGDIVGARNDVQQWLDENPVSITIGGINVRLTAQQRALFGNVVIPGLPVPQMVAPEPAPAPMSVNINLPRGSRGVDVIRQVSGQARRSGRRYGVPVVHYARTPR